MRLKNYLNEAKKKWAVYFEYHDPRYDLEPDDPYRGEETVGGIIANNKKEAWQKFLEDIPRNQRDRYRQTRDPELQ